MKKKKLETDRGHELKNPFLLEALASEMGGKVSKITFGHDNHGPRSSKEGPQSTYNSMI